MTKCAKRVVSSRSYVSRLCTREAKPGSQFCWQHMPAAEQARQAESTARFERKMHARYDAAADRSAAFRVARAVANGRDPDPNDLARFKEA